MHRKLAVIDGRTAFVGGINVVDDEHLSGDPAPRFDFAVRVEGPLLADILPDAAGLWRRVAWTQLRRRGDGTGAGPACAAPSGDVRAAFLVRDNLRHRRDIEDAYLAAIRAANSEIVIACAYFFPGRAFRHALREAARRGVRVTLLLQGRVEYTLQHYATRALYGDLLASGVGIYEYERSYLHAKVAVVDGHWATVGSSNIDPLSFVLAREANVVVEDSGFAAALRDRLVVAMRTDARELKPSDWRRESLPARLMTWACYGVVRLLAGLTGYARMEEFR
jgi:cardiolipin synthase